MEPLKDNRRNFPRIVYPCLIKIFSETQGQEVYLTHTENISTGGCYLIVPKLLKKGTSVTLELDLLDDGQHMNVSATVAWVEKRSLMKAHKTFYYDTGVIFDNISEKDKLHLENALGHLIKKGYKPTRLVH